jgi:tetratricopeptide (TPR) repeat protein
MTPGAMRSSVLSVLLMLLGVASARSQTTLPLNPLPAFSEDEGLKAMDRQDFQRASEIFTKLAADDPKDYSAWFNLALAEAALQKYDPAIAHLEKTLELKPGLYEAEVNLGLVYLRDHKLAEAEPHFEAAARLKPNELRAQMYLADNQLALGKDDAAAKSYEAALKINPKSARAELGLGQSLLYLGSLDQAAEHYREAAALDPKLKSHQLELAAAYTGAKRPAEAIAILKELPDAPGAAEQLGELYLAVNQPQLAVEEFELAVKQSPNLGNQMALATAYIRNNQEELAAPILEKSLAANPNDYDVQMALGRIWRDKRDYRKAVNRFYVAAKLKPNDAVAWSEIASACVIAEMYPEAIAALDQIHRLNADKPGHYYLRAIVLDKLRQIKPALENYRRFLELSQGKSPDEEFKARQRVRILEHEVNR